MQVHDVLRALKEKLSKEGRETVEALSQSDTVAGLLEIQMVQVSNGYIKKNPEMDQMDGSEMDLLDLL